MSARPRSQSDTPYVSIRDALKRVDYTKSYITHLARDGKVNARMVDGKWQVDLDSLKQFELEAEAARLRRQEALRRERLEEQRQRAAFSAGTRQQGVPIPSMRPALVRSLAVFAIVCTVAGATAVAANYRDATLDAYRLVLRAASSVRTNPALIVQSVGDGFCAYSEGVQLIRRLGFCTDGDDSYFVNIAGPAIPGLSFQGDGRTKDTSTDQTATDVVTQSVSDAETIASTATLASYVTERTFASHLTRITGAFSSLNQTLNALTFDAATLERLKENISDLEREIQNIDTRAGRQSDKNREEITDSIGDVTVDTTISGSFTLRDITGGILTSNSSGVVSTTTLTGSNITADSLDFSEFKDALTLDASTTVDLDTNDADLTFDTSTLFIDAALDRVGIGTTTPGRTLSVAGDARITGSLYDNSDSAGTDGMVLQTTGTGFNWVATSTLGINGHDEVTLAGGYDYLTLSGQEITLNQIDLSTDATSTLDISDRTNLAVSATGLTLSGDSIALAAGYTIPLSASTTEWATAYGWGDHSTQNYFDKDTDDTDDITEGNTNLFSQWSESGSDIYYNSGNVGIGTSSPLGKLEVFSEFGGDNLVLNTGDFSVPTLQFLSGSVTGQTFSDGAEISFNNPDLTIENNEAGSLYMFTNDSQVFAADSSGDVYLGVGFGAGNVGIGDSSPVSLLTVGSGDAFQVNSSGVVAAGTWNGTAIDVSDYTNLSVSATGLELSADAIALSAGYTIPLTASTTEWATAYGWGDHSTQGYLTNITGESLEDLSDVASMTQSSGDLLYWTGSSWSNIATSSLGISGGSSLWTENGSDIYYTSGNVGVGTSSPSAKLHLYGSGTTLGMIESTDATASSRLDLRTNGSDWELGARGSSDVTNPNSFFIYDQTNTAFRMLIDSSGNVGIGTTSPNAKLDIAHANDSTSEYGTLRLGVLNSTASEFFTIGRRNTDGFLVLKSHQNGTGGFRFNTQASGSDQERLTILNNGSVGIGDSTPDGTLLLDVEGSIGASTLCDENGANCAAVTSLTSGSSPWSTSGSDIYYNSGNVGIGTSTPGSKLHIDGDSTFLTLNSPGSTYNQINFANNGADTWHVGPYYPTNDFLRFYSSSLGSDVFVINDTNGNVGIGTSSPRQRLDLGTKGSNSAIVAGTFGLIGNEDTWLTHGTYYDGSAWQRTEATKLSGLVFDGGIIRFKGESAATGTPDWETEYLTILDTGNVGIGTTSPGAKLTLASGNLLVYSGSTAPAQRGAFTMAADPIGSQYGMSMYSDDDGRGFEILTSDFAYNATGSSMVFNFGTGTGNTHSMIDAYTDAKSSGGNLVLQSQSTGNVGIGTTSPDGKLTVYKTGSGASSVGGVFKDNVAPTYASNADNLLTVRGTGSSATTWRGRITAGGDNYAFLMGEYNSQAWLGAHNAALDAWADIYINPDGAANVHIGDSGGSPTPILSVVNSSGNVGIGTTSPDSLLHIEGELRINELGGDGSAIKITERSTGYGGQLVWLDDSGNKEVAIAKNSSDQITFYTNEAISGGSEKMVINPNGNVGIGDTTPDGTLKLDVEGSIGAATLCDENGANCAAVTSLTSGSSPWSTSGSDIYYTSGNVGIGTSSPSGQLDVYDSTGSSVFRVDGDAGGYPRISIGGSSDSITGVFNRTVASSTLYFGESSDTGGYYFRGSGNHVIEGDVGIGTSTPSRTLTVDSDGNAALFTSSGTNETGIEGDTIARLSLKETSTGAIGFLQVDTDEALEFYAPGDSSADLTIDSSGNVGIGTTSPMRKFTVSGSGSTANIVLERTDGAENEKYWQNFINGTELNFSTVNDAFSARTDWLTVARSGTDISTISFPNGNVGIGTTSPASRLHVNGGDVHIQDTTPNLYLYSEGGTNNVQFLANITDAVQGGFVIYENSNAIIAGRTNYTQFFTQNTERMRIDSSGNVGIGTTSPSSKLEVYDTDAGGTVLELENADTGGKRWGLYSSGSSNTGGAGNFLIYNQTDGGTIPFTITSSGNVGIGDSTPDGTLKLDVEGSIGAATLCDENGANCAAVTSLTSGSSPWSQNGSDIYYSSGDVGIGTTGPVRRLDVVQTTDTEDGGIAVLNSAPSQAGKMWVSTANDFILQAGANTSQFVLDSSGNVGIGTTSPSGKLTIVNNGVNGINLFGGSASGQVDLVLGRNSTADARFSVAGASGQYDNEAVAGDAILRTEGGALRFNTNAGSGTSALTVLGSNGNVGIGTSSPSSVLTVKSSGTSASDGITLEKSGSTAAAAYIYEIASGVGGIRLFDSGSFEGVRLHAEGDSWLDGGNVGIGTKVTDDARVTITHDNSDQGYLNFNPNSFDANKDYMGIRASASSNNATKLHFGRDFTTDSVFEDLVTIDGPTGNVGIGTTSPTALFTISGEGGADPNFIMEGDGEQTFRFLNTSSGVSSSTRVSWKMANRNNTDWTWIMYTDSTADGADDWQLRNRNGSVLFADTNGNVGIGTTSPTEKLVVGGTDGGNNILINDINTAEWKIGTGGYRLNFLNDYDDDGTYNEQMVIDQNGNVGIGTTNPGSLGGGGDLALIKSGGARFVFNNSSRQWAIRGDSGSDDIRFTARGSSDTVDSDVMTLQTGGNVGIGTTNPNNGKVEVKGGTVCVDTNSDDNASSCIASESDERLKDNITTIPDALDVLRELRGVSFDWRTSDEEVLEHYPLIGRFQNRPESYGLIAQEVMNIIPEAVSLETVGDDEVQYYQLEYDKFIPFLIEGVKELDARTAYFNGLEAAVTNASSSDLFADDGETFWQRLVELAAAFKDGVLKLASAEIEYVQARELCLADDEGTTCIDRGKLQQLLDGETVEEDEDPVTDDSGAGDSGSTDDPDGSTDSGAGDDTATDGGDGGSGSDEEPVADGGEEDDTEGDPNEQDQENEEETSPEPTDPATDPDADEGGEDVIDDEPAADPVDEGAGEEDADAEEKGDEEQESEEESNDPPPSDPEEPTEDASDNGDGEGGSES